MFPEAEALMCEGRALQRLGSQSPFVFSVVQDTTSSPWSELEKVGDVWWGGAGGSMRVVTRTLKATESYREPVQRVKGGEDVAGLLVEGSPEMTY